MGDFSNRLKDAALPFIAAISLLVISPASASPSSKSASPEPALSSPAYGTSAAERHDEQVISECDKKADQAKVSEDQRMDFVRKCLVNIANDHG
jgi:hypothetical protein